MSAGRLSRGQVQVLEHCLDDKLVVIMIY